MPVRRHTQQQRTVVFCPKAAYCKRDFCALCCKRIQDGFQRRSIPSDGELQCNRILSMATVIGRIGELRHRRNRIRPAGYKIQRCNQEQKQ